MVWWEKFVKELDSKKYFILLIKNSLALTVFIWIILGYSGFCAYIKFPDKIMVCYAIFQVDLLS